MVKFFGKFASLVPAGATVVDLGAGDGKFATKLADLGDNVIAVDRKEPAERQPDIEWVVKPIDDWYQNLPADFVADAYLLKNVLQFLEKRFVFDVLLPGLAIRLSPGGVIGIETFGQPSDPPFKNQSSFYTTKELLVPFSGWEVVMEEGTREDAKDMNGNPRRFFMTRIIVRKP